MEVGSHELPPYFRTLAGHLVFEECAEAPYTFKKDRVITACPIANSVAVWGYAAFISKSDDESRFNLKFPLEGLAHKIERITYSSDHRNTGVL